MNFSCVRTSQVFAQTVTIGKFDELYQIGYNIPITLPPVIVVTWLVGDLSPY